MVSEEIKESEKWEDLGTLLDKSKNLSIEIINSNKIELLEAMMFAPRKIIALKILHRLVFEDKDLIRAERILTKEEEELLDNFEQEYEVMLEFFDYNIKQYRKSVYQRKKRTEEEEEADEID